MKQVDSQHHPSLHEPPRCNEATLYKFGICKGFRLILYFSVALLHVVRWPYSETLSWYLGGVDLKDTAAQHTLPTILSVVDDTTGNYINALENPLYETIQKATISNDIPQGFIMKKPPTLQWDRSSIRQRDSIKLEWTVGQDSEGNPVVADEDVLVLNCDGDLLEVATIRQARATSRKHSHHMLINDQDDEDNEHFWYFPSFPILRRYNCNFSLYKVLSRGSDENDTPVLLHPWATGEKEKDTPVLLHPLATSNDLQITNAHTAPTAIHLAFGDTVDEMVVQFKTGYMDGTPVVHYGMINGNDFLSQKNKATTGTSHTYTAESMCQAPANTTGVGKFQPPGMIHVVRLQGLAPNTTYQYRVGVIPTTQKERVDWSDVYSFVSAPVIQADSNPFSFVVYGDQGCPALGWGDGGVWISAMMAREAKRSFPIRAVHHFGDLSYAVGVAHVWDEWFHMISSFTTHVPLMVGVGNHEYDHTDGGIGKDPSGVNTSAGYHPSWGNFKTDSFGECGVPTANLFTMPNSKGSNGVFWFSHVFASVHMIMLSTEHDLTPGSFQYQWLEQNLKSVDRDITPWIILELHRPLYEAELDKWDYSIQVALRVSLEDLLRDYQVDLVLGGHYHSYLRTCQGLYQSNCGSGGPLHITVGSAGAHLNNNTLFGNDWTEKFIQGNYGYGRITVMNASALHFEFVRAGSDQDPSAGLVLDDVWLKKHDNATVADAAAHAGAGRQFIRSKDNTRVAPK